MEGEIMTHNWIYDDDVIACYLCKYGLNYEDNGLLFDIDTIGSKLGMGAGSLRARVGNFNYLNGIGNFCNAAKLSKRVFEEFKDVSKTNHLKRAKEILGLPH